MSANDPHSLELLSRSTDELEEKIRENRERCSFLDDTCDGLKLSDEVGLLDDEFHDVLVPSPKKRILS